MHYSQPVLTLASCQQLLPLRGFRAEIGHLSLLSSPLLISSPPTAPVMLDIIRDSTFGQILHYFSNGRLASFPEDKGIIPPRYLTTPPSSDSPDGNDKDKNKTATSSARPTESHGGVDSRRSQTPEGGAPFRRQPSLIEAALVRTRSRAATAHDAPGALPAVRESEETMEERFIVGWEGDGDDQDNPKNWSSVRMISLPLHFSAAFVEG